MAYKRRKNYVSKDFHFEEQEFKGLQGMYDVQFHARGEVVDCGIGAYECHGFKGYDSRMGIEEFEISGLKVERWDEDKEVWVAVDPSVLPAIEGGIYDKLFEKVIEELENVGDDRDEGDC